MDKNQSHPEKLEATAGKKTPFKRIALGVFLLAGLALGILWFINRGIETTDDAFVESNVVQISPRVSGYVTRVLVNDNQTVHAGDLLAEIDPRDYRLKVTQADAQVAQASAQADLARADLKRFQALYQKDEISRQRLEQAVAAEKSANAQLRAAQDAELHQAKLNLSYTQLVAPVDGRVTRKSLDLGQLVQPGVTLMSLVYGQPWVVANFKETQLTHMKVGQKVEIRVDAYPNTVLHGHVQSIQSGTGSRFSILPAENATGNFVKVVQRVPVKILLDEKPESLERLAPGMSVAPKVFTGS
jgi:membrane fusion protein (multidrug efflux system)